MFTNENYQVSQGGALSWTSTICDGNGNPIAYTGSETLTGQLWPGGAQPVSYTPSVTWATPSAGLIMVSLTAADTAALAAGRYEFLARVQPPSSDPLDAYGCTIDILQGPGTDAVPTTYPYTQNEATALLYRYGRSWLRQLQTGDDTAGWSEQCGRARSWIEDLAHAHYRVAAMTMVVGSQAFGPRRSGARSTWLQDQLDNNTLMLTDQICEAAAKKALAFICEGQVGMGDKAGQYARLARMYHSQADYLGSCLTLSLDTNGDGFPDVSIDCSCADPMYS
jgi:hypothetical protein